MPRAINILACILFATTCHGYTYTGRGYTPGAWPASNVSPRALGGLDARNWDDAAPTGGTKRIGSLKDIWVGDIYHALWEKTVISQNLAAGSNLVKATWYRTERANLVAFKQAFPGIAGGFVDFASTEATVVSYMTTSGTQVLPTFTVSNLLIRAGLPANYLTYTPYRMIGGYGSLDGSVTPSNVQSGFTVKDYGWDGLKRMITNLTTTQVVPDCNKGSMLGATEWRGRSSEASGWSGAKACAIVNVSSNSNCAGYPHGQYYNYGFPFYASRLGYSYGDPVASICDSPPVTNLSLYFYLAVAIGRTYSYTNRNEANVPRTVELYGNVTNAPIPYMELVGSTGTVTISFNNYGTGFTEGNWHLIESETLTATQPYSRTQWGKSMSSPTWPSSDPGIYDVFTMPGFPDPTYSGSFNVLGLFLLNRWTCYY